MLVVPRISEFYGIVIAMYYREHGVPHVHATYAGETVSALHRDELRLNWARARENAPLVRIDPLP